MSQGQSAVSVEVGRLVDLVAGIFGAIGCTGTDSAVIAEELVIADQMGLQSHGTTRVKEYLVAADAGNVDPAGVCSVSGGSEGSVLVDGGRAFGQVVGRFALEVATERARTYGVSCVVTRNSYHLGRIGSLAERACAAGLIAIATVAVGLPGKVAPWSSRQGMLGTNPFGYGVPLDDEMVIADFATSTMAEGAIALAARDGRRIAEGMIIDSNGNPTTDPGDLFADPPGAILPVGGAVGYKGYALNLLPEFVAAGLAGYGADDPTRPSNCLFLIVVDPSRFLPLEMFKRLAGQSARVVRSAEPLSGTEVLLPGEREQRSLRANRDRVSLPRATIEDLRQVAQTHTGHFDLFVD